MIARPLRTVPAPDAVADVPPTPPRQRDWDDDPRTTARYDDRYWDAKYDNDEPEEDS